MNEIKLRLVYHFWIPKDGLNEIHKFHFNCLEKFSNVFNESLFVISVDKDDDNFIDKVKYVEHKLLNIGFIKNVKFKVVENLPEFRESKTFKDEIVDKLNELDGLTFFAHSKASKTFFYSIESNKLWIASMYYFNLNFINDVKNEIYEHSKYSYGFFRHFNNEYKHIKNRWMYYGTFMWLNCQKINDYIKVSNINLPSLCDRWLSENFIGNVTEWGCSASKGGWVMEGLNLYTNCKENLELYVDEDELNKFMIFYNKL